MKKIFLLLISILLLTVLKVKAGLPLQGKLIILDIGHGSKDVGTSYQNIYEKDINLSIGKVLAKELIKSGASVILTREGDYDLSSPNAKRRKKSDFDNRIKLINKSKGDLYISLHTNYLEDQKYQGPQAFYLNDENKNIALKIQARLNTLGHPREVKKMPDVYMYKNLKIKGVLLEVGFISNAEERSKLIDSEYQKVLSKNITLGIIDYFTK